MPAWEYITVFIHGDKVCGFNEREFNPKNTYWASDYFNQLGAQGWDLVGIACSDTALYTAIFKRAKAQLAATG